VLGSGPRTVAAAERASSALPRHLAHSAEGALQLSAKLLPRQTSTAFMRFKVSLLRGDQDGALECLQEVIDSEEYSPEILQVGWAVVCVRTDAMTPKCSCWHGRMI
jgi:hypothetical protein